MNYQWSGLHFVTVIFLCCFGTVAVAAGHATPTMSGVIHLAAKGKPGSGKGRDKKAPRISITSPSRTGSSDTSDDAVTLRGTARDNKGVVRVEWQDDFGNSGVANGTRRWQAANLTLRDGATNFVVTAIDAAGNWTSALIQVTKLTDPDEPPVVTNQPPVISGNPPASVLANSEYSFTPQAVDADGDPLTFSIENMPTWATFDTRSGELAGIPGAADVGTEFDITVAVTDGIDKVSMAPFEIDVTQAALASKMLNWVPPVANDDGSTLLDLAGYKIYYGTSPDDLRNVIDINDSNAASYLVENLAPNTWYFALTAYNDNYKESVKTDVLAATVE